MAESLAIVMPVYNEEDSISFVVKSWSKLLDSLGIEYTFFLYNDGSKDKTRIILESLSTSHPHVKVIHKENSGHGSTILLGYKECSKCFDWVFQTDSDNELPPASFKQLWEEKGSYDFLLGRRAGRYQPLARKIMSAGSRLAVSIFYGKSLWDVNSPYRLMRSKVFSTLFECIPLDTFAPNTIITGYVALKKIRAKEFAVPYTFRTKGEVSLKKWKLVKASIRSFVELIIFRSKV